MRKSFVVTRESATSPNFVLQLRVGDQTRAWSIRKGPTLDPSVRRIAQPIEAPSASAVSHLVWDRGTWDGAEGGFLDAQQIEFTLKGTKLHGTWSLRRTPTRWQLAKQEDEFAVPGADAVALDRALDQLAHTRHKPALSFIPLALATLADAPPEGEGWIHEVKLDGYRIEALVEKDSIRLMSRNAKDWTDRFPQVVKSLQELSLESAVLDGEVVVLNERGVSSFQQLQQSGDQRAPAQVRYYVFDLLAHGGKSLTRETLEHRLPLLEKLLERCSRNSAVQPVRRFDPDKGDVLQQACNAGEEGVISKRIDARYLPGRGRTWVKSKCGKRQEFVIVGYTEPQGSRTGFGSLLIAVNDARGLVYAGRVGTGFDAARLDSLYGKLVKLETNVSPLVAKPVGVSMRTVHWVKPKLVAEIAFTEWTDDAVLRHPSFKGLREDKRPEDVVREDA